MPPRFDEENVQKSRTLHGCCPIVGRPGSSIKVYQLRLSRFAVTGLAGGDQLAGPREDPH